MSDIDSMKTSFFSTKSSVPKDNAQVKTQTDGPTRVIEKPKGNRVFGTPELIYEPHVPSVKTIFDEASLGE